MKNCILALILVSFFLSCKEESKAPVLEIKEEIKEVSKEVKDSITTELNEVIEMVVPKTRKQIKYELIAKGFKTFDYVDVKTKDTVLMQQYFGFFKKRTNTRTK